MMPATDTTLQPAARPPAPRAWLTRIFAVTWLAYAGFYLCRKNFSVLMPVLQSELGLDKLRLANIVFGYSLCYSLGQFVAGPLSDRFGPRLVVGGGLALAVISNLLMGFSTTYSALLLLGLLNGCGQSCGWPGLVQNMAAWFVPEKRGVVMAWWTTNYVIGGFLATVLATWVLANPQLWPGTPWRAGFWLPALVLAAVALVFGVTGRNRPADEGFASLECEQQQPNHWTSYRLLLGQRAAWVTALCAASLKVIRYSFLFWLPLYLTEQFHYSNEAAGYLSSAYEIAGFAGAVLAGYLSDRVFGARRFPVASIMLIGLAGACHLLPMLGAMGHTAGLVGIVLVGLMTYGPDTLMQGAASQDLGADGSAGAAAGFVCGIASLGQLISPYLVAVLAQRFGWDALFQGFVMLAGATALLSAVNWNFRAAATMNQTAG